MSSTTYGHYLADLPIQPPYPRKFKGEDGERRGIKVTISRYYGIGVHYYVSAIESNNPIVLPNGDYQLCWDDEEGKGETWNLGRTSNYKAARRLADRFIDKMSKKSCYVIELQDCEDTLDPVEHYQAEWD